MFDIRNYINADLVNIEADAMNGHTGITVKLG